MDIRRLKTSDLFTVVDMLKKIGGAAGRQLKNTFTSTQAEGAPSKPEDIERLGMEVALLVLETCYTEVRDDLVKWFSSLLSKSIEEYMDLPVETTLDIIDHLVESEDAKNFFSKAWQLSKKMRVFAGQLNEKKTK